MLGGIVPLKGPNKEVQLDCTVFPRPLELKVDGLGKLNVTKANVTHVEGGSLLSPDNLIETFGLSGDTLPQVSATNGTLTGRYHIVSGDGAGPIFAVIDTTATGKFSNGIEANVTLNVRGNKGRIRDGGCVPYSFSKRSLADGDPYACREDQIQRRAPVVDLDYPFEIAVPKGIECEGKVAGKTGVCFMKISNLNHNGPFGGTVAFQISQ